MVLRPDYVDFIHPVLFAVLFFCNIAKFDKKDKKVIDISL